MEKVPVSVCSWQSDACITFDWLHGGVTVPLHEPSQNPECLCQWNFAAFCLLYRYHGVHFKGKDSLANCIQIKKEEDDEKKKLTRLADDDVRIRICLNRWNWNEKKIATSKYFTWTKWYCIAVLNIWCFSASSCMHTKAAAFFFYPRTETFSVALSVNIFISLWF